MADWLGKQISIKCIDPADTVFQGTIKEVTPEVITIFRAFRNGVPVRKVETEIKIASSNILSLDLIPESTTSGGGAVAKQVADPNQNRSQKQPQQKGASSNGSKDSASSSGYQAQTQPQQPRNNNPPQSPTNKKFFSSNFNAPSAPAGQPDFLRPASVHAQQPQQYTNGQRGQGASGRSYQDNLNPNGNRNANNGNGKNGRRYPNAKSETFGTPVNDPTMDEDFDFEKNLALFNKEAVWEQFNQMNGGKPDLLHHQGSGSGRSYSSYPVQKPVPKYRHDENILQSAPTQYRQIEVDYNSSREYVSDDGLIIPSIPLIVRNRLQTAAEAMGLSWERQIDILSRGTCDTALQLLGGAPRLKPNNKHQWPVIVVVCEEPYNERKTEIGICTGRMLATHGLKVVVYVQELTGLSRMSYELDLFKATGNRHTANISELPSCDLIVISSRSQLSPSITKWVNESRCPVLAIDPPVAGFVKIQAKVSILPILPLDDINTHACGKLYLCNLCIPDKFFHDAGIKYSSPFGHKQVIPIHTCD